MMPDKTKVALLEIAMALRDMIESEGHDVPPEECNIVRAGGCTCGAWERRNEVRSEAIRILLKHQEAIGGLSQ